MTLDDELRDALRAEADQSQPSPDGWERLQERLGSAKGRRTRVWLPVLAAAVVVLAAVGAWQLASDDDLQVDIGGETSTTIGTTTAPTPSTSIAPGTDRRHVPPTVPAGHRRPDDRAAPGRATTIVAVTVDGRLVVLDAATGPSCRAARPTSAIPEAGAPRAPVPTT